MPQNRKIITAQCAILAGFAVLVLWRMPGIILGGGRFWAEEGKLYFAGAWTEPWYDAWFAIHVGYINLAAGLGAWLGLKLGGLAHAPMITVIFALCLQCLPIYVILTHEFPWRRSILATGAAVLLCALTPVMGEVWLNSITSQFHLALFSALIFAAPLPRTRLFLFDCAVLFLAVFSGPASCFLMPLFVLRAFTERQIKAVIFAVIVFCGFCIQAGVYVANIVPSRGGRLDPEQLLSAVSLHTIVLQFTGSAIAQRFANYVTQAPVLHTPGLFQPLLAGPLILLLFYGIIGAAIWQAREIILARLFVASLVITYVSFYEALDATFENFMNVVSGQRYALMPAAANALLVFGLACASRAKFRTLFVAGSLVLLLVGVTNYRNELGMFEAGPAWKPQVAAWQHDPTHRLAIWPTGWVMNLTPSP